MGLKRLHVRVCYPSSLQKLLNTYIYRQATTLTKVLLLLDSHCRTHTYSLRKSLVGEKMISGSQDEFKRCHELVKHYDYLLTLLELRETSSGVNTTFLLSSGLVIFSWLSQGSTLSATSWNLKICPCFSLAILLHSEYWNNPGFHVENLSNSTLLCRSWLCLASQYKLLKELTVLWNFHCILDLPLAQPKYIV